MARTNAEVGTLLRSAGLRRTPARLAVLGAVERAGEPLTHARLAEHPAVAGIDPVTLYRTLATLEDAGLVHRVQGTDGAWRTCPQPRDRPGCPGNHAHFLCERCGAMRCLLEQALPRVRVPAGFVVHGRHLVAQGLCDACAGVS